MNLLQNIPYIVLGLVVLLLFFDFAFKAFIGNNKVFLSSLSLSLSLLFAFVGVHVLFLFESFSSSSYRDSLVLSS